MLQKDRNLLLLRSLGVIAQAALDWIGPWDGFALATAAEGGFAQRPTTTRGGQSKLSHEPAGIRGRHLERPGRLVYRALRRPPHPSHLSLGEAQAKFEITQLLSVLGKLERLSIVPETGRRLT